MKHREGLVPSIQFAFTSQPQDDWRVGIEGSIGAVYQSAYYDKSVQYGAFALLTLGANNHLGALVRVDGQYPHESDAQYGLGGKAGVFMKILPENNHDITLSAAYNSAYVVNEYEGAPQGSPREKGNVSTFEFGFAYRLFAPN